MQFSDNSGNINQKTTKINFKIVSLLVVSKSEVGKTKTTLLKNKFKKNPAVSYLFSEDLLTSFRQK